VSCPSIVVLGKQACFSRGALTGPFHRACALPHHVHGPPKEKLVTLMSFAKLNVQEQGCLRCAAIEFAKCTWNTFALSVVQLHAGKNLNAYFKRIFKACWWIPLTTLNWPIPLSYLTCHCLSLSCPQIIPVVTHSGFIRSLLLAVEREPYSPMNTELVPVVVTRKKRKRREALHAVDHPPLQWRRGRHCQRARIGWIG